MHYSNTIINRLGTWTSVTSRDPIKKSIIYVKGFDEIKTTYFALGVSTKPKHYGGCQSLQK